MFVSMPIITQRKLNKGKKKEVFCCLKAGEKEIEGLVIQI